MSDPGYSLFSNIIFFEVLVAIVVAAIFVGAAIYTFIAVIRDSRQTWRRALPRAKKGPTVVERFLGAVSDAAFRGGKPPPGPPKRPPPAAAAALDPPIDVDDLAIAAEEALEALARK